MFFVNKLQDYGHYRGSGFYVSISVADPGSLWLPGLDFSAWIRETTGKYNIFTKKNATKLSGSMIRDAFSGF